MLSRPFWETPARQTRIKYELADHLHGFFGFFFGRVHDGEPPAVNDGTHPPAVGQRRLRANLNDIFGATLHFPAITDNGPDTDAGVDLGFPPMRSLRDILHVNCNSPTSLGGAPKDKNRASTLGGAYAVLFGSVPFGPPRLGLQADLRANLRQVFNVPFRRISYQPQQDR